MITGKQIREARQPLGWTISTTALSARVTFWDVADAERLGVGGLVTVDKLAAIQRALEGAGIEFTDGEAPRVRPKTHR